MYACGYAELCFTCSVMCKELCVHLVHAGLHFMYSVICKELCAFSVYCVFHYVCCDV